MGHREDLLAGAKRSLYEKGYAGTTARDIVAAEKAVAAGGDPDAEFPTNPGSLCSWCDFRRTCPAGQDVQAKQPWAAVEHLERPDG